LVDAEYLFCAREGRSRVDTEKCPLVEHAASIRIFLQLRIDFPTEITRRFALHTFGGKTADCAFRTAATCNKGK